MIGIRLCGKVSLGEKSVLEQRSEFGVSSWRGSRVDGRSYLLSGAIDGSEVNEIIQNPKWELESSCFTFDLVPLVVRSVCIAWRSTSPATGNDRGDTEGREDVHEVFQQRGSYLDVEGIKWVMSRPWHYQKERTIS
ncbi:hypothetical protein Tco_0943094 [Tanacetum coccineum]